MEVELSKSATITLFAATFIIIGWMAPAMFATYAPADYYMQSNAFVAEDIDTSSESQAVCFNRTVHKPDSGDVFMELYLVDASNGEIRQEVYSSSEKRYVQQGTSSVLVTVNLPDDIRPGEYYYQRIYSMELANGRVTREFVYQSETFTASPSVDGNGGTIDC